MRKVGLCLFYGLCVFTIVFSLYWISLPQLRSPAPQEALPDLPSQQTQAQPGSAEGGYYLGTMAGRWLFMPAMPRADPPAVWR